MRGTGKTKSREKIENQSYAVGSPDYPTVSGLVVSLSLTPCLLFLFSLHHSRSLSLFRVRVLSFSLFSSPPPAERSATVQPPLPSSSAASTATTSFSSSSSSSTSFFRFSAILLRGPRSSLIQSNENRSSIRHTRRQISLYIPFLFPLSFSLPPSASIFLRLAKYSRQFWKKATAGARHRASRTDLRASERSDPITITRRSASRCVATR